MNCHDCRKHLHPYLDSELEVQQNLDILQHLNACTECARIFEIEEASWERVRSTFADDGASESFRAEIPRLLATADQRDTWRRALGYIVPLGVAAAFLIHLQVTSGSGDQRSAPGKPGWTPPVHAHGPGIEFAVSNFLSANKSAQERGTKLLSKKFLETHGSFNELDADEARSRYLALMGPGAAIPSALRGKRIHGAMADAEFAGTNVHSLLLSNHKEQVFGVYVLDREKAGIDDMHDLGSEGMREDYRLERCRSCNVITVTRGDKVFIFVTHDLGSVKPAIELARETF